MTFDELREWSIQHNVEKRTKEGFLDVITNIGNDSPNRIDEYFGDKFNPEYLEINIYKVAFTIANWPVVKLQQAGVTNKKIFYLIHILRLQAS
ncbi:hypothetical protein [Brevibacillus laterosporus]|uniref:hypothetical protein n=1 Tax=Brevibacillus laterosporus TaxID=1465 RepID=UPI003D24D9F4